MRKAFTLIELLIVVAIIAILAGIGISNFLEAQARSKTARAKSDIRTFATALETYTLDHNAYVDTFGTEKLTSPVSYLTSLPRDPFIKKGDYDRLGYMNTRQMATAEELANWDVGTYTPVQQTALIEHNWFIWSNGPDADSTALEDRQKSFNDIVKAPGADYGLFYDATNGTVSRGDVVRGHRLSL